MPQHIPEPLLVLAVIIFAAAVVVALFLAVLISVGARDRSRTWHHYCHRERAVRYLPRGERCPVCNVHQRSEKPHDPTRITAAELERAAEWARESRRSAQ